VAQYVDQSVDVSATALPIGTSPYNTGIGNACVCHVDTNTNIYAPEDPHRYGQKTHVPVP